MQRLIFSRRRTTDDPNGMSLDVDHFGSVSAANGVLQMTGVQMKEWWVCDAGANPTGEPRGDRFPLNSALN